jgi:hypothetical protein
MLFQGKGETKSDQRNRPVKYMAANYQGMDNEIKRH